MCSTSVVKYWKAWLISSRLTATRNQTPATCFCVEQIEGNEKAFNFARSHISARLRLAQPTWGNRSHAWYVEKAKTTFDTTELGTDEKKQWMKWVFLSYVLSWGCSAAPSYFYDYYDLYDATMMANSLPPMINSNSRFVNENWHLKQKNLNELFA